MDPRQTLVDALTALADNDLETAEDRLQSYDDWRRMGGFRPQSGDAIARSARISLAAMVTHGEKVETLLCEQLRRGLDEFTEQYLETALWSTLDPNSGDDNEQDNLDAIYGLDDIDSVLLRAATADCATFRKLCGPDFFDDISDEDNTMIAHKFWLHRNGHGTGLSDLNMTEAYITPMIAAAEKFTELDLYTADGKVTCDRE